MIDPIHFAAICNAIFFLVVMLAQVSTRSYDDLQRSHKAAVASLSASGMRYAATSLLVSQKCHISQEMRHLDHLITMPLLMYSYWSLAKHHGMQYPFMPLMVSVMGLVIASFAAERSTGTMRHVWFAVGVALFCATAWQVKNIQTFFNSKGMRKEANLSIFFLVVWAAYPATVYQQETWKNLTLIVADFASKGLYPVMLLRS